MYKLESIERNKVKSILGKITIFVILTYFAIDFNLFFNIETRGQITEPIYYIFGGTVLSLVILFGNRYSSLIIITILLYSTITDQDIGITGLLVFIILTIMYTFEVILMKKLGFNSNLKRPLDLFIIILVTFLAHNFIIVIVFLPGLLPEISLFEVFISVLDYWFRDIIGFLIIYPVILFFSNNWHRIKKFNLNEAEVIIKECSKLIKTHPIDFLALISIPLINQIALFINTETNMEIFYIIYIPGIWLASKHRIEFSSLLVPLINIGLILNRSQLSLNVFEIQLLIFVFTTLILFLSIVIGERNSVIEVKNNELNQSNFILTSTNNKLTRSNKELEQFAYVASHDLQEPLRAIIGYLQLYDKKYGTYPDKKSEKYIKTVIKSSLQMQNMINDLLAFSRVGTTNQDFMKIDLNEVMQEVLTILSTTIAASKAEIKFTKLSSIYGNKAQMHHLFQNLISNSIKYNDLKPQIEISTVQENRYTIVSVKDNGIGISSEHFNKIFVIFQRLHAKHEYRGSGIGLAICKKIVEQHSGQIWLESEENVGTTFYIKLPLYNEQSHMNNTLI